MDKSLETAKRIVKQGNCKGIRCICDLCPIDNCSSLVSVRVHKALQYIKDHEGGSMDRKEEAKARLEAIKKEVVELEKIIAGGLTFRADKLYVGLYGGTPFIMVGIPGTGYRFNSFKNSYVSSAGWAAPIENPQECLDYHLRQGFTIHEFFDVKVGFQYFLTSYKG